MSLYLKYRPKDFENLVWQDFIKSTIKKAISENKTVWAYLLCWPRWTWKTSTARIIAKAVNCLNPNNWNPCNKCNICNSINNESLVDVIEIDAASHTWVDNIRELISKAQFRPTHSKYKIYIIDEVHMLSTWAFNALLKILEEPPKYLKFILATTETHKVPETIISRCQKFDFRNISKNDIENRLKYIAKEEKIKIDEQSLDYIIKSANGWLRNAISLFEQLIKNSEINFNSIISTLWIIEENKLIIFLNKLLNKDKTIINDFEKIIESWKNIKLFFKQLIFFTKEKSIEKLKNNEDIKEYINILETLDETYSKTKNSLDENTTFLIWILKLITNNLNNTSNKILEKEKPVIEKEKILKKNTIEINNEKTIKSKISHNDINNIFSDISKTKTKENIEKWKITNSETFDKNLFLNKTKENWIKSAERLSLVWSTFKVDDNNLIIHFKNNFTKKTINNPKCLNIIKKSLEEIWLKNINLILK